MTNIGDPDDLQSIVKRLRGDIEVLAAATAPVNPAERLLRALIKQVARDAAGSHYWKARWINDEDSEIAAWLGSLVDAGWTPDWNAVIK